MELLFPTKSRTNALALVSQAQLLGHKRIICCYTDIASVPSEPIPQVEFALLVKDKKAITKAKANKRVKHILGLATREFFEDKRITGIVHIGMEPKKDHTHYRKSLTQVEAQLVKTQKKELFFCLSDVFMHKKPEIILGRWMQDKRTSKNIRPYCHIVSGASTPLRLRSAKDLVNLWNAL